MKKSVFLGLAGMTFGLFAKLKRHHTSSHQKSPRFALRHCLVNREQSSLFPRRQVHRWHFDRIPSRLEWPPFARPTAAAALNFFWLTDRSSPVPARTLAFRFRDDPPLR